MIKLIREYLKAVPFAPFEIHSSSGSVFTVDHPENCAILNTFVAIALPDGESAVMLSFLHITGVKGRQQEITA